MMESCLKCKYCGRDNFGSTRALTQHQQKNAVCHGKLKADLAGDNGYMTAHEYLPCTKVTLGKMNDESLHLATVVNNVVAEDSMAWAQLSGKNQNLGHCPENYETAREDLSATDEQVFGYEDDDNFSIFSNGSLANGNNNDGGQPKNPGQPIDWILGNFTEYCDYATEYWNPFTKHEVAAIKLMTTLRNTKASLDTYEAVMEWHLKTIGEIRPNEGLGASFDFISRKKLFKKLRERYNTNNLYCKVKKVLLPSSKVLANVVWNDAQAVMQSLLTDPRIRDQDYLFFNNDPFCPPPEDLDYVADLNTGLCYTETYKHLITKPGKQVLLPTPLYIDGAATGQFSDLPITAMKISLGILNRKARDKPEFWRTLGYIPSIQKHKSRGRRMLLQSGHVDAIMAHQDAEIEEGNIEGDTAQKAQDLHTMLDAVLESYIPLQNSGFYWDLMYQGKLYKGVEFVPFVPFVKSNMDEADQLSGSYTSRQGNVKQLCRYCECPTSECNDPLADYPLKTVKKVQALIDANDMEGLQKLSQQYIKNAMYKLRFGSHNDMGIHGACPMEMLHAILLGIFKYIRDCLFEQMGPKSKLSKEFNALAREYGELLTRCSDRDMPKTKFANGIQAGKLMAKEFVGILLCMAACLRSSKGKELLSSNYYGNFAENHKVDDWIMLVETLLQWESWLKSEKMSKKHVQSAIKKHRYIMYLIKKVGRRMEGMGFNTTKFHAIMHIATDILFFGVPLEVDTGSNEAGHKPTKTAAKLTQKKEETFDLQTSQRLEEIHLLDLAMEELSGRALWKYFEGHSHPEDIVEEECDEEPRLGGAMMQFYFNETTGKNAFKVTKTSTNVDQVTLETALVDFVVGLQDSVSDYMDSVVLRTNHHRKGQTFWANTMFMGQVWCDWVMVDWDDDGVLPNKIWGFVDLTGLPYNSGVEYGGLVDLQPGLYAIVESATFVEDSADDEGIFSPIIKEVGETRHGFVTKLQFYLADCEAFVAPAVVVPDIGGKPNAYFLVKNRAKWREDFMEWLEDDVGDNELLSDIDSDYDFEQRSNLGEASEELEFDEDIADESSHEPEQETDSAVV